MSIFLYNINHGSIDVAHLYFTATTSFCVIMKIAQII